MRDEDGYFFETEVEYLRKQNAELVETLKATYSWISMWANHQGNCEGGTKCTCGKTAILFDVKDAIAKATGGE